VPAVQKINLLDENPWRPPNFVLMKANLALVRAQYSLFELTGALKYKL